MSGRAIHATAIVAAALTTVFLVGCGEADNGLTEISHPTLTGIDPRAGEQIAAARSEYESAEGEARRAAAAGHLGMLYHTYGMLTAADEAYGKAELLTPDDARWPYYRGLIYRETGRHEAAVKALRRSLELDPGNVPGLLLMGETHLEAGERDLAEGYFRQAVERDGQSAAALAGAGRAALAREDYAVALERLVAALEMDPTADGLNYAIGQAYMGLGDERLAADYLQRPHQNPVRGNDPRVEALQALRQGIVADQRRADALAGRGGTEGERRALRAAVAARPDEPRLRLNLAQALIANGDYREAEAVLQETLRLDPEYVSALYDLGVVYDAIGRREDAVVRYRAALGIDPGMLSARWNLALDLRRLGRFEDALPELQAVIDADPARSEALLVEALTLARLERWVAASDRLKQAVRAFPEDAAIVQAAVRVFAASPTEAARDGQRALALADRLAVPGMRADVAEALAMVAAEVGDFATAIRLQEQLLRSVDASVPAPIRAALQRNLTAYRAGAPCREPWPPGHPNLDPPDL